MAGPIGTPMASPMPTVLVDTDAAGESKFVTRETEVQGYLEQKITNASLNVTDADIKHGPRTVLLSSAAAVPIGGAPTTNAAVDFYWNSAAAANVITLNLPLDPNRRIASVSMYGRANGAQAWVFQLYKLNMATGVSTQIGTNQTSAITAAISILSITGLTETTVADTVYYGIWTSLGAGQRFYGMAVTYDKVATP